MRSTELRRASTTDRDLSEVAATGRLRRRLTELPAGTCARLEVAELGVDDLALLEALGMSPSCRLRVCKAGNPWILEVRESRIGLADAVARQLFVAPEVAS